jgi:hypothetical protein
MFFEAGRKVPVKSYSSNEPGLFIITGILRSSAIKVPTIVTKSSIIKSG